MTTHDLPDDTDVCAHKWTDPNGVEHECRLSPTHADMGGYHACSCGTKGHIERAN